jgi:hypothetical protein
MKGNSNYLVKIVKRMSCFEHLLGVSEGISGEMIGNFPRNEGEMKIGGDLRMKRHRIR